MLNGYKITVFGGSKPKQRETAYHQAFRLGKLLGTAGYTVLNGGYIGTMEAVSRGVYESGGYVIGITCDEIERWRPVSPNPWLHEEMRFPTLRERLYALIDLCDAALVLPGGIGTLAEMSVMWSQMQTRSSKPRPLILIGNGWKATFGSFHQNFDEYLDEKDLFLLSWADQVEEAVAQLQVKLPLLQRPGNEKNIHHNEDS